MKYAIGTNPRDADSTRRDVQRVAERDGAKNFPPVNPDGTTATDYFSDGLIAEATATDSLTKAGHLATQRVDDDAALGNARAETAQHTALTANARHGHEDALAEQREYKQRLPLSAKHGFWNRYVVWAFLVLLGAASGAAVTAALLSVTTDSATLSYTIGAGVALAAVGGGAGLGFLLRRRDLDNIKEGKYSSHGLYSTLVIIIAGLGLIGIAIGVAGLRDAASKADAARRAENTQITVFIPGQQQQPADQAKNDTPQSRGVSWPIWLAFELGFAAAALSIEFQRADGRVEHGEELNRNVTTTHKHWKTHHALLSGVVAVHETGLAVRADHDGSVILLGTGQRAFNVRLSNDYRHCNLAQRAQGGDPFEDLDPAEIGALEASFNDNPGVDVVALSTHTKVEADSGAPFLEHLRDNDLLEKAYVELGQAPERPKRADVAAWTPGAYLALDASAQALQASSLTATTSTNGTSAHTGEPTAKVAPTGRDESQGTEWDEYPDGFVSSSGRGNGSES